MTNSHIGISTKLANIFLSKKIYRITFYIFSVILSVYVKNGVSAYGTAVAVTLIFYVEASLNDVASGRSPYPFSIVEGHMDDMRAKQLYVDIVSAITFGFLFFLYIFYFLYG